MTTVIDGKRDRLSRRGLLRAGFVGVAGLGFERLGSRAAQAERRSLCYCPQFELGSVDDGMGGETFYYFAWDCNDNSQVCFITASQDWSAVLPYCPGDCNASSPQYCVNVLYGERRVQPAVPGKGLPVPSKQLPLAGSKALPPPYGLMGAQHLGHGFAPEKGHSLKHEGAKNKIPPATTFTKYPKLMPPWSLKVFDLTGKETCDGSFVTFGRKYTAKVWELQATYTPPSGAGYTCVVRVGREATGTGSASATNMMEHGNPPDTYYHIICIDGTTPPYSHVLMSK